MEIKNCIKNIMQSYSLIVEFNFKRVLTKLNACRDKLKSIHWSSLKTEKVTKKLSERYFPWLHWQIACKNEIS